MTEIMNYWTTLLIPSVRPDSHLLWRCISCLLTYLLSYYVVEWVSEWVSTCSFLTAHQHIIGYSVPWRGREWIELIDYNKSNDTMWLNRYVSPMSRWGLRFTAGRRSLCIVMTECDWMRRESVVLCVLQVRQSRMRTSFPQSSSLLFSLWPPLSSSSSVDDGESKQVCCGRDHVLVIALSLLLLPSFLPGPFLLV